MYLILFSIKTFSQNYIKSTKNILGTFHTKNTTINGMSFGAFSEFIGTNRHVKTNGIRLEVPGIGFLAPLGIGNQSPLTKNKDTTYIFNKNNYTFSEIINGINLSTGTFAKVNYNGIPIGMVSQFGILSNGIAIAGLWNFMAISNRVQISGLLNETLSSKGVQISVKNSSILMKGIQIGLFNKSKKTKGIQLGLWKIILLKKATMKRLQIIIISFF